ncbi:MAG: ABC transporter substrate-binding protein [Xanthobacteraceae bacterium]
MADIHLTFACGPYDRVEALRRGEVKIEGVDLTFIANDDPREIFDRMANTEDFDAGEMSSAEFIQRLAAEGDKSPLVAIPVIASRVFRHGFIAVNTKAGIGKPKDLEGKRIGVELYTMSAAIWIRGLLQDEYGVDLSTVHWIEGAMDHPGAHGNPGVLPLLRRVDIEKNNSGKSLSELLAAGAIDATIGSRVPAILGKHPHIQRLFPNYREVEKEYFKRTHIFPIMHIVVIRRKLYEKYPFIASSLYNALVESKECALAAMRRTFALRYMLPWLISDLEEINELFGGDPWPYGIERNRPTLDALVSYLADQGMIAKPLPIESLFVPVREKDRSVW